ncbi:MAG: NAD-dependent epimerase/dehydratase family protein [Bdellovibrionales bacterium]|nr:NAD-dependent epimerase/dehydratase family protein [Bdellovibrionales bacterium]
MKVLVTGGGGFLGFHIVKLLLAEGHEVRVLGRHRYPQVEQLGGECYVGSVTDLPSVLQACEGIEEVYHVAAIAGVWGEWEDYYNTNYVGTLNVIEACQTHKIPRLIFTSSPSVVFAGQSQTGLNETTPYSSKWLTHYPKSKMMAEKAVLAVNSESLKTVALRPHLIWGPGDNHIIPRLVTRARSGQLAVVGNGKNKVDIIYVENAAKAHLQVAEELRLRGQSAGRTFFLGQKEPVVLWDFINEVLKREGLKPVTRKIPFFMAYTIGRSLEWVYRWFNRKEEPRMTRFIACQLAKEHYYDHSLAEEVFGYDPHISVSEGLDRLYAAKGLM